MTTNTEILVAVANFVYQWNRVAETRGNFIHMGIEIDGIYLYDKDGAPGIAFIGEYQIIGPREFIVAMAKFAKNNTSLFRVTCLDWLMASEYTD